jgi:hypothetical protein
MGYSTSTPPALVSQRIGGAPAIWVYSSADDDATVNGAGYFTNGDALGMTVGDVVLVYDTATPKTSFCFVNAVTAGGAATTGFGAVS